MAILFLRTAHLTPEANQPVCTHQGAPDEHRARRCRRRPGRQLPEPRIQNGEEPENGSYGADSPRFAPRIPTAYFRTNFWRQPPEGLTSHPPVSPPKTLPNSSAASPSGRVPSMKALIEPSFALPIRIPFFHPGFRIALPPPSGASFAPPILWLDSESDTISVSSFRIQTLLGRPKCRHSSTMFM